MCVREERDDLYCEKQYTTYSVDSLCYIYHSDLFTWSLAVQNCFDTAGSLASAETPDQQEFLHNISKDSDGVPRAGWIGLMKAHESGLFSWWIADTTFLGSYTGFNSTSIPDFCNIELSAENYWQPYNCSNTHESGYFCVADPACTLNSKFVNFKKKF
ncbi:type-2 ice-structuring protein-like [Watersipora subatra]|uniref:type-2 ice-structuring protein-like n=1 Tax=Watersipora subatra TaxID=2589382 RepID=UPI00355C1F8F